MNDHVEQALKEFNHIEPKQSSKGPSKAGTIQCGQQMQHARMDNAGPLTTKEIKFIQQVTWKKVTVFAMHPKCGNASPGGVQQDRPATLPGLVQETSTPSRSPSGACSMECCCPLFCCSTKSKCGLVICRKARSTLGLGGTLAMQASKCRRADSGSQVTSSSQLHPSTKVKGDVEVSPW